MHAAVVQATPEQRDMVSWLVEATGDASPLVRSEVAVALSRFASVHCLAFQVRPSWPGNQLQLCLSNLGSCMRYGIYHV